MSNYVKKEDGTYADLEYTKFPAQCDSWANSKDLTADMLKPAKDYRDALENGSYNTAQGILTNYPNLRDMLINADTINRMKHGIMAVERMFTESIETYIKSFTDQAKASADLAKNDAKEAEKSKIAAGNSKDDCDQLVKDLRTLKGSLPTDFTDYTEELADARNYIDNTITQHDENKKSHSDMRDEIETIRAMTEGHTHDASDISSGALTIEHGGTGATTKAQACVNLGVLSLSGGLMNGTTYYGSTNYYINSSGEAKFSKAYGAIYNDYAEFFPRGECTQPGDIIALDMDSQSERYIKAKEDSKRVVGVHSDEYAMLIGGDDPKNKTSIFESNIEKYIPVSLAGRVRVRVIGKVKTGDLIIPSNIPGVGRAVKKDEVVSPDIIVGYAVEGDDLVCERRLRVRVKG